MLEMVFHLGVRHAPVWAKARLCNQSAKRSSLKKTQVYKHNVVTT